MEPGPYRVALSADFRRPDGSPAFPVFDLSPLEDDPRVELAYVDAVDDVMPAAGLEDFDALILLAHRFERASVPASGRLALVARFGVGYDTVDVASCTEHDIAVVITPDGVRRPVAQAVLTLLLALAGKLFEKDRLTRAGAEGWAARGGAMGIGLTGRTLGQLGIGNIGAEVFRLARPLEMRCIAHDPYADPALAAELGVELVDLDTLFRDADFLSVSCPLTDETHKIVNAERLALMKSSAYLINTSRGPVIDEPALTAALAERRIAGAGLDVFEAEPCPADAPILALDNVIVTPHALCWTDQCFAGIGACDVRAALEMMAGRVPDGIVNREIVDAPGWRAKLEANATRFT